MRVFYPFFRNIRGDSKFSRVGVKSQRNKTTEEENWAFKKQENKKSIPMFFHWINRILLLCVKTPTHAVNGLLMPATPLLGLIKAVSEAIKFRKR